MRETRSRRVFRYNIYPSGPDNKPMLCVEAQRSGVGKVHEERRYHLTRHSLGRLVEALTTANYTRQPHERPVWRIQPCSSGWISWDASRDPIPYDVLNLKTTMDTFHSTYYIVVTKIVYDQPGTVQLEERTFCCVTATLQEALLQVEDELAQLDTADAYRYRYVLKNGEQIDPEVVSGVIEDIHTTDLDIR